MTVTCAMILAPIAVFRGAVILLPQRSSNVAPASTFILDRDGNTLFASSAFDGQWRIPLTPEQINPNLLRAIVAVEDSRFYQHSGVDWRAVIAAAWEDATRLSIRRGASTVTMQVARLREPARRSILTKLLQAIRAEQIERRESKQQILLEYVNNAPFGGNLVGAGAASWRYFGRSCKQLSLAQCALLAGLPQAPNHLRPDRFPDRAKLRRDHVLDRMLALHLVSQAQHDQAVAEPVEAKWLPLPQHPAARGPLQSIAAMHHGRSVRTTIDPIAQSLAEKLATQRLETLANCDVDSIAVVVLDTRTSDLLSTVSLSSTAGSVDLTRSRRSTGSTLKPFIYAAAFDAGVCDPGTVLNDAPDAWSGYSPANYDHKFRGQLTAAEALAASRNLPAMAVLSRVGLPRCIELMSAVGFRSLSRTPDRYGLPLAIGGAEATPLEMAEAYATLARGGTHREIRFVKCDTSEPGASAPLILRGACFAALGAIADRDRTSDICPEARRSNVAWKTGTSSGHRDAWCAAVTCRYTVVVWLGNATARGSAALVGADAAAPVSLSLIAALDPVDDAWPATQLKASAAHFAQAPATPAIISPADGAEIVVNGESQRTVQLRAAPSASRTWWFIDGASIGNAKTSDWSPAPGSHEIRLIDDTGRCAVAHVRVR